MQTIPDFAELITLPDCRLYAMLEAQSAALAVAPAYSADRRRAIANINLIRKALRFRLARRSRPTLTP